MKRNIKMNHIIEDNGEPSSDDEYCNNSQNVTTSIYSLNNLSASASSGSSIFCGEESAEDCLQCENCKATFKVKGVYEKHRLFCATLAGMRTSTSNKKPLSNGRSDSGGRTNKKYTVMSVDDDALLPSPKEMFMLIQELTLNYNKVKEELDVIKTWAKMVGRRIGGGGGGGANQPDGGGGNGGGLHVNSDYLIPFTTISRQKRQNMEMILNEDDADMSAAALSTGQPCPVQQRPSFTIWYSSFVLSQEHLDCVFQTDLVSGIVSILLKMVSAYTNESGKSHLIPFKFTDVKQGSFYIYDTPFSNDVPALPQIQGGGSGSSGDERKWRFIEPCEFQLMVNSVHKLLLKEFKKWQDRNWELQSQLTKQKQKATLSYENVMSSFQCSPAMASCDGMYSIPSPSQSVNKLSSTSGGLQMNEDAPVTPPSYLNDVVLSEDFASLYNKYADKVMGGTLTPDTIITRVRAKLWKDMKAWML